MTIELQGSMILLHGPPKVGKTQLAASFPTPTKWIATEPGHKYIPLDQKEFYSYLTPGVKGWDEFKKDIIKELESTINFTTKFHTIVIDTVRNLYQYCMDYVCAREKVKHPSDMPHGKGWNAVETEFRKVWSKFLHACAAHKATIIVIDHSEIAELQLSIRTQHKIMCSLPTQARRVVVADVDHIWYLGYDHEGTTEGVLKSFTENRTLYLMGNTDTEAGTRDPAFNKDKIEQLPKTGQYNYILKELNQ